MTAKKLQDIRILLVDDDDGLREILAFLFKRQGYQVFTAKNGEDAYQLARQNSVDAIISDIRMPGGDGIELLERMKSLRPETPVVLLITGFADISTEEAHSKGADALISKPFNKKVLQDTVTWLLTPMKERWAAPVNQWGLADHVAVEMNVKLQFQELSAAMEAHVLNLGRGGMYVSLPKASYPNVNDSVDFKIMFDGSGYVLTGKGVVRWVRIQNASNVTSACGIEFTYLSEKGKELVIK